MSIRIKLFNTAVIIALIIGMVAGCGSKKTSNETGKMTEAKGESLNSTDTKTVPAAGNKTSAGYGANSYGANNYGAKDRIALDNTLKIIGKDLKEDTDILTVDIKIPVLSGLNDKAVESRVNNIFENDAVSFKNSIEKSARDGLENSKEGNYNFHKFVVQATFNERYNLNGVLSLTVFYYQYTGGAHGMEIQKGYTFDLKSGRLLQLPDLFEKKFNYRDVISNEILKRMEESPEKYMSEAITNFNKISDDRAFYIEAGNLVVYYGEYEIAPYAAGIPEFKIPFSKLSFSEQLDIK